MGILGSKPDPDEPKTIAEAKTEISEVLKKIKEHYGAINQMRMADRAKWKYFNKKVEELEVVKARALKQERKRQRDCERAKELQRLEATTFSREIVITPYETKPPPPPRELKAKSEGKGRTMSGSSMANEKANDLQSSRPHSSSVAHNDMSNVRFKPNTDCKKNSSTTTDSTSGTEITVVPNKENSNKEKSNKEESSDIKSNPKTEELLLLIDIPATPEPRISRSDGLHVAKLVSVPMMHEDLDSEKSERPAHINVLPQTPQTHKELDEQLGFADSASIDRKLGIQNKVSHEKQEGRRPKTKEFIESISLPDEDRNLRDY